MFRGLLERSQFVELISATHLLGHEHPFRRDFEVQGRSGTGKTSVLERMLLESEKSGER